MKAGSIAALVACIVGLIDLGSSFGSPLGLLIAGCCLLLFAGCRSMTIRRRGKVV